jgi:hypothetical protein
MHPKHIREKRSGARALTAVLSVLAVLLAALCALSWMLLSDPNAGRSMPKPSDRAVSKVIAASIAGKEAVLTPEEVSGWLNGLLLNHKNPESDVAVTALSVTAKQDGTADVYLPVEYHGRRFGVTMNLSPSYDEAEEQMKFAVNSVHVGRLPVPVSSALDFMEKKLPSILSREGNALVCNTKSLFRVDASSGAFLRLNMTELELRNQAFYLKFQTEAGLNG